MTSCCTAPLKALLLWANGLIACLHELVPERSYIGAICAPMRQASAPPR